MYNVCVIFLYSNECIYQFGKRKVNVSYAWVDIIHMSKIKPEQLKNSSTIAPPAGIEPKPLRCRCYALTTKLKIYLEHDTFILQNLSYIE